MDAIDLTGAMAQALSRTISKAKQQGLSDAEVQQALNHLIRLLSVDAKGATQ